MVTPKKRVLRVYTPSNNVEKCGKPLLIIHIVHKRKHQSTFQLGISEEHSDELVRVDYSCICIDDRLLCHYTWI